MPPSVESLEATEPREEESEPIGSSSVQTHLIHFSPTSHPDLCEHFQHTIASAFSTDPGTMLFSIDEGARYKRWWIIMRNYMLRNPTKRFLYMSTDKQACAMMYLYPTESGAEDADALGAGLDELRSLTRPQLQQSVSELVADLDATEARLHQELGEYYYLAFLGVQQGSHGRGHGGRLLQQLLAQCDARRLPCVLAANSEPSRRLYLRHGFQLISERRWTHPEFEGSAELHWMVRRPAVAAV